jgi:hypothetical protein
MRDAEAPSTPMLHPIARLAASALSADKDGMFIITEPAARRIQEALDGLLEGDRLLDAVEALMRLSVTLHEQGSRQAAEAIFAIAMTSEPELVRRVESLKGLAQEHAKAELGRFRQWTGTSDAVEHRAPRFEDEAPENTVPAGALAKDREARAVRVRTRALEEPPKPEAPGSSARTAGPRHLRTRRGLMIDAAPASSSLTRAR